MEPPQSLALMGWATVQCTRPANVRNGRSLRCLTLKGCVRKDLGRYLHSHHPNYSSAPAPPPVLHLLQLHRRDLYATGSQPIDEALEVALYPPELFIVFLDMLREVRSCLLLQPVSSGQRSVQREGGRARTPRTSCRGQCATGRGCRADRFGLCERGQRGEGSRGRTWTPSEEDARTKLR